MNRPHFSIAGVPIRVEIVFWITAVLIGLNAREGFSLVLFVAIVFASVLLHEMGHAIAYRFYGQRSAVVLHAFGGATQGEGALPKWRSIVVSLAGPLSTLLLVGLPVRELVLEGSIGRDLLIRAVTGEAWEGWYVALDDFVWVNVYWAYLNLMPIRPLDGGHVMSELIGQQRARVVSIGVAGLGVLYGLSIGSFFLAMMAGLLGYLNYSEWKQASGRGSPRGPGGFQLEPPAPGPDSRRGGRRRRGRGRLRSMPAGPAAARQPGAPAAPITDPAQLELRAWNALRNGDVAGARRVVTAGGETLGPYLRGSVLLASGDDAALDTLAEAYSTRQPPNLVPATVISSAGAALALAQRLLGPAATNGRDGAAALQTHLHYAERYRDAALVGEALHSAGAGSPAQTAFEIACAWSRADEIDRAVDWLETAAEHGFRAAGLIDGEPDLAAVRLDPRWPVLRAALS